MLISAAGIGSSSAVAAGAAPGPKADSSIAGGYYPADYEWPWVTALTNSTYPGDTDFDRSSCTATLIGPRRVLTAAHCVVGDDNKTPEPASNYQALVGRRSLKDESTGERRNVTAIAVHPLVQLPDSGEHTNHAFYDVAVMFLDRPVSTTPATIGTENDWADLGTVMGWGHTNYEHDPNKQVKADHLKAANLELWTDERCHREVDTAQAQHYDEAIHVCGNDPENDDCVTHGDSGGPLMVWDGASWKLIGVTSFFPTSNPCGPIGFAWVAGPTLRSWALTVADPSPPLTITRREVRSYVREMIRDNTSGRVRRLKRSCSFTSYRSMRCRLRWRIARYKYSGRAKFWHLEEDGEILWTYSFKGKRRKVGCSGCTRRLRW